MGTLNSMHLQNTYINYEKYLSLFPKRIHRRCRVGDDIRLWPDRRGTFFNMLCLTHTCARAFQLIPSVYIVIPWRDFVYFSNDRSKTTQQALIKWIYLKHNSEFFLNATVLYCVRSLKDININCKQNAATFYEHLKCKRMNYLRRYGHKLKIGLLLVVDKMRSPALVN